MLLSTAAAGVKVTPPSPLGKFLTSHSTGAQLRTGYTHLYEPGAAGAGGARSTAEEVRQACRSGAFAGQTSGLAPGFVQANLVALPKEYAFDFLTFAMQNPKACPLLAVTAPGDACPGAVAPGADLRTDLPRYRIWRDGDLVDEVTDASGAWGDDFVGFLLGCSFSWEHVLASHGLTPRHMEEDGASSSSSSWSSSSSSSKTVPMYRTNVANQRCGPFQGQLVVSMRPYRPQALEEVEAITARYPGAHGSPVHWGDPAALGISNLAAPDWGDAVALQADGVDGAADEVPVFWACGVTPQTAIIDAKLPCNVVTHSPGRMFVCDIKDQDLRV